MKLHCAFLAMLLWEGASAFAPIAPQRGAPSSALKVLTEGVVSDLPPFPTDVPFKRIQGSSTVMTYPMPVDAERVEMMFRSSGRPMKVTGKQPPFVIGCSSSTVPFFSFI
jgi:hypothetical protein